MANKKFKDLVVAESGLRLSAETANRALFLDASGDISSSSVTDTELGYLSGVTSSIQTQLGNNATAISDHLSDASDAHDASAISNVPAGNLAATDVQGALNELQSDIDTRALASDLSDHISDAVDAHDASAISNVPSGNLAATDVQAALNELQSDVDSRQLTSEKGQANGYASLDGSGKVPVSQLPSAVMTYEGVWNASTNSPSLADGVGDAGQVYRVSVAGSQDLGSGSISFEVGDYVIYNGSIWEKSDTTDAVASVNSQTGVVVLDADDLNYTQADPTDWTVADNSTIKATLDEVGQRLIDLENGGAATGELKVSANDTTFGYLEDKVVGASGKIAISTLNDGANEDLQISIGADVFDKTVDDSDDITEGSTKLFFTDERAQDAVGTILVDSASIDFTYNDGTPSITAAVLPAGVDHDSLQNFVANEHIDHSSVSINTNANSGLSGGGDITASRSLVIDPMNASSVSAAGGDQILVADASDTNALKRVSVQSIVDLAGAGSPGDIAETSFSIANNQASPANVTGLAFSNAVVRGFEVLATVEIDATADLYETFALYGIQKGASWDMSQESVGDDSGIVFSINSSGQIQYISQNYAGFVSGAIKFRARTTSF